MTPQRSTTMRRMVLILSLVATGSLGLALGACGDEAPAADPETTAETPETEPADEVAEVEGVADVEELEEGEATADEVPIPEDFEAEVAASITIENLEGQLAALELEVGEE